jgi:formylglycine-generating enzyme required for sulfatase activity/predicted Ser/Thr protein kinase
MSRRERDLNHPTEVDIPAVALEAGQSPAAPAGAPEDEPADTVQMSMDGFEAMLEGHASTELPEGYLLEGRYEIVSVLGRGGFGVVYKAKQKATGQLVAVKVLLNKNQEALAQARFEREMALIARLNHPNIVRLIDSGRMQGGKGHLFAVLEFIEGESLAERIQRVGPLGVALTRRLMTQALEALAYAHQQGIIHRDLKPQNIMVTGKGALAQARVLDFGLAAMSKEARAEDYLSLTGSHQFQGTPGYMSPEQLTNGEVTPRLDLYAMGLVWVECLLGKPMMQASSLAAMIFLQLSKEPVPLPEPLRVTPLGPLLTAMTAKSYLARPSSAEEVLAAMEAVDWQHPSLAALEVWAQGDGASALHASSASGIAPSEEALRTGGWFESGAAPQARKARRWVWGAVAAGALLLALAGWWILRQGDSGVSSPNTNTALTVPTAPTAPAAYACERAGQAPVGAGRCCWPGQRWDDVANQCTGQPTRCPEGSYPDATTCEPLGPNQRSTATLLIPATDPPGAQVLVNGAEMGAAPLSLEGLPLGDFSITYRLGAHADALQFITLTLDDHTATLPRARLSPQHPGVPSDMAWVPPGRSWSGCLPKDEAICGAEGDPPGAWLELPGFAIDKTEVTVAGYRECVTAGGCATPSVGYGPSHAACHWGAPDTHLGPYPMNCVMWSEAAAYCQWRQRRLPTAAEWEKAARGPTQQPFPWGDAAPDCERVVMASPAGNGCGRNKLWPVASHPLGASPYGVFDMLGGVEEWTADTFTPDNTNAQRAKVRGGGFDDPARKLRLSRPEDDDVQTEIDDDLGFRCAMTPADAPSPPPAPTP